MYLKIVWIVQSFSGEGTRKSGGPDDAICESYPQAFLRPTMDPDHDRVVRFLLDQSFKNTSSIFCFPYPMRSIDEGNLQLQNFSELDGQ